MWISILIAIAVVLGSAYFNQPEAQVSVSVDSPHTVAAEAAASPSPSADPSPTATLDIKNEAAVAVTPAPTPYIKPMVQTLSHSEVAPAVAGDCDGKEVHVERRDGQDVLVEIDCDKNIAGGSISNSVDIDASTGGSGSSGGVKVDIKISNKAGSRSEE